MVGLMLGKGSTVFLGCSPGPVGTVADAGKLAYIQ